MYKILEKKTLNANTKQMVIDAPHVAKKAQPGQFIILRVDEDGERIPLTIASYDREKGTIMIIFQEVGATTKKLGLLNEGDCLHDFVGPLGRASELEGLKKVAVVGGGLGCAIAYPQAKALHEMGAEVDLIAGFRNKDIIILKTKCVLPAPTCIWSPMTVPTAARLWLPRCSRNSSTQAISTMLSSPSAP